MSSLWARSGSFLRALGATLGVRRETAPIDSVAALCHFAGTRAAFVSQKKLYGYLKTRMGTRFPSMFEDDVFVASINAAKMHVFAACLSDITVHVVALTAGKGELTPEAGRDLARRCYLAGIEENHEQIVDPAERDAWLDAFERRLDTVHWENVAAGGDAFTESPAALYRWAPIADGLKQYDREIVENSIRFAWAEIIRDFRNRAETRDIVADWQREYAPARD